MGIPIHAPRGVIAAAVLALLAGFLMPSLAAGAPAGIDGQETDELLINAPEQRTLPVAADDGTAQIHTLELRLFHDNSNFTVTDGRLTVDITQLAGVAEVIWPEECTPSGSTAVCSFPQVTTNPWDDDTKAKVRIRAAAGAPVGAHGSISYSAEATGGPDGRLTARGERTTIMVGSGPDLVLDNASRTGLEPRSTVAVPFSLVNNGNEPVNGLTVRLYASAGLDFETRQPECTYTRDDSIPGRPPFSNVACSFDDVIQPGATFELPELLRLNLASYAFKERLDLDVGLGEGVRDLNPDDNYRIYDLIADNSADFTMRGTDLTGSAGQTVTADLTFSNKGRAWVAHLGSSEPLVEFDFRVPPGTTATAVPDECRPIGLDGEWLEERLGAPRYVCGLPRNGDYDVYWLMPKAEYTLSFDLRIDTEIEDATGSIQAKPWFFLLSGEDSFPFDPNSRNNAAKVVVNATPPTT